MDVARARAREAELLEIRQKLNLRAEEFCKQLLRNGRKAGNFWETSNIRDEVTGSFSLKVHLSGGKIGQWTDYGLPRGAANSGGDILSLLVECQFGGDFGAAIKRAREITGIDFATMTPAEFREAKARSEAAAAAAKARAVEEEAKYRSRASQMWHGAFPLVSKDGERTPAYAYLAGRGIALERIGKIPGSLRYHPAVWNVEMAERYGRAHAKHPCLLFCIVGLNGDFLGVHRIWLDVSAGKGGIVGKLPVEEPKKTLGNSLGGHIPLWKGEHSCTLRAIPAGTDVYMGESNEDCLSVAMASPRLRIVGGVGLSKMVHTELPDQMRSLVMIGQNDAIGSQAADSLEAVIAAQQAQGRKVRTMFPPQQYKDFNDMLMGKVRG